MEIFIIIIALILSCFFSGSETIFLSSSKIKLEVSFRKKRKYSNLVKHLVNNPEAFIITTLLGNNITIVTFSSIFALHFEYRFSELWSIIISSMIALVFAEIIPKATGWEFANRLIFPIAPFFRFFQIILYPLSWGLNHISSFILFFFKTGNTNQSLYRLTSKDVEMFIDESKEAGIVEQNEHEIISNIFSFRDTILKETMVPRTDIIAVPHNASISTAIETIQQSGFSRIPVYEERIDNITGVIYAKDLFYQPARIKDIIQDIQLVPDTKRAIDQLQEFQQTKTSMTIVVDEYGGTAGLVTFEDLVEELFGEIYDEFDSDHDHLFKKLNGFTFLIKGRAEINEINTKFDLHIPEGDYTTIAGFIIEQLGTIPAVDDVLEHNGCKIIITKADRKRVIEVKIIKKP